MLTLAVFAPRLIELGAQLAPPPIVRNPGPVRDAAVPFCSELRTGELAGVSEGAFLNRLPYVFVVMLRTSVQVAASRPLTHNSTVPGVEPFKYGGEMYGVLPK